MIPRSFPPAPGWSPDGHRIKSEVDYGRGPEKTWVYGALRVRDGHAVTMTASSRNSASYQQFLQRVEAVNPAGDIYVVFREQWTADAITAGAFATLVHDAGNVLGDLADALCTCETALQNAEHGATRKGLPMAAKGVVAPIVTPDPKTAAALKEYEAARTEIRPLGTISPGIATCAEFHPNVTLPALSVPAADG
ncbi:hypothetical protein AB0950_38290 [Streptomyces sp. NPDC007189]|uniref:hypothetical protein n=1 Tax=Streptomyces sp. NPDC007189 TaxID=3154315 RepID=UPI0034544537